MWLARRFLRRPFLRTYMHGHMRGARWAIQEAEKLALGLRIGYWYYKAIIHMSDDRQECLVRRAINPLPDRIELFAPVSLKSKWALNEDAILTVEITETITH